MEVPRTVLVSIGYSVSHGKGADWRLSLQGVDFRRKFDCEKRAWEFAEENLRSRTQLKGHPDHAEEARLLGFEVTVMPAAPKHGWRHRDLGVCSLRHDYPTTEEAWRAAWLWSRRFPSIWSEQL